jgi:hypothetical protein
MPSNADMEEVVLTEAAKKLVMGIGAVFQDSAMNIAFQKSLEMGWIRLLDLVPVLPQPMLPPGPQNMPQPCRVFKITNTGDERLREIGRRKAIDKKLNRQ